MSESQEFASRLIAAGASGYAAAAASLLLERHQETAGRFGANAFRDWQAHLTQRLDELAAALLAGEAEFFVSEVAWSRTGFAAREVPLEDLEASLRCLLEVLSEELPPAAGDQPRRYLEQGLAALAAAPAEGERQAVEGSAEERLSLAYLEAALGGDRRGAMDVVLSAVADGFGAASAFDALMAAQRRLGEMWHAAELAIPQEHFVTAITQSLVDLLAQQAERAEPNGKTVLVATVPGNAHDLGARVVAAFFEMAGWRAVHLGGTLPAEELALGLAAFEADLLALSMTLSTQLNAALKTVHAARAARPGIKVLLGGRSLVEMPRLCTRVGADACAASAEEAVATGARLVGIG